MADEVNNPPLMWKSRFALARVLDKLGRKEEAQGYYRQAAEIVEQTASSFSDPALKETFLSAGLVREVLEHGA